MDRRQALRRASPSGPLNATDQPQGLLRVSIRHYGVTRTVRRRKLSPLPRRTSPEMHHGELALGALDQAVETFCDW